MTRKIYKIMSAADWAAAQDKGAYAGSPVDMADGYIHLSGADQVAETLARHFAGDAFLVLAAFDADALGPALRWEASRGGALFPHLYAPLPVRDALAYAALTVGPGGAHVLPDFVG